MMSDQERRVFYEWLSTRPPSVQKLGMEFPYTSVLMVADKPMFVIGYTENDMLILSSIDPRTDYDRAREVAEYVCARHFRLEGDEND